MSDTKTPPKHLSDAFNAMFSDGGFVASVGSARPKAAQLDNLDATLTPEPKEAVVVTRWRLKHTVSNLLRSDDLDAAVPGVCKCGTAGHEVSAVSLTRKDGKAGVSGVFFCDSPWLCPTCAPRRAAQRAEKVTEVFKAAEAKGGRIVFVTLTVKHGKKDSLADLKSLVMTACRKARQGKPWALAVERFKIAGTLVGPEVTWSEKHGWHFHLHVALVVFTDIDFKAARAAGAAELDKAMRMADAHAAEAGEWLMERYRSYISAAGGRTSRQAQDVTVVWTEADLAEYLAKGSAAWEVSNAGATKQGKEGLTPWDLAARAEGGDAMFAGLFREYAEVMPGTRSCVITKSLADKLGIQPEDDSDNPGVKMLEDEAEVVGTLEPYRWHKVLRRGHAPDVLRVVGAGWDWPAIDDLIAEMLKEKEAGQNVMSVSARELVLRAKTIRDAKGCKSGAALQQALAQFRKEASAKGKAFGEPCLKTAMELLGDGVALAV
uniref:Rep protein n=1 Tax=Brucella anthropi TaxID=529 RepID=Q003I8_BRUAN|nr:protein rep [Brucella anthropi]ABI98038.1 rep protein [Brucella anthropi]